MKIQLLKSHVVSKSGYGEHIRDMLAAVSHRGVEVSILDDMPDSVCSVSGMHEVKKSRKDIPFIYPTNWHHRYTMKPEQYSIVLTMFESDRMHPSWVKRFNDADRVWVPSKFNYDTFLRSGVQKDKLVVIRAPIKMPKSNGHLKTKRQFTFLSVFDSTAFFYRKGVDVLLKSYCKAFTEHDDVCLVIKTNVPRATLFKCAGVVKRRGAPKIEVINNYLSEDQMVSLYNSADAYVLPSRGEGIGRPYLYAMARGLPVIATGWSGNTEFMNTKNSFLVDYTLKKIPLCIDRMIYPVFVDGYFAEPDSEHLTEIMHYVVNHQEEAKKRGERAKSIIRKNHSYAAVAKDVIRELQKIGTPCRRVKKRNVFYHLFPLHFPGEDCVTEAHGRFSQKEVKNVAIYGTGAGAKMVFEWISKFPSVKKIVFCDRNTNKKKFLRRKVIHYKDLGNEHADLLVLGVSDTYLHDVYVKVKDSIPVPIYSYLYLSPI